MKNIIVVIMIFYISLFGNNSLEIDEYNLNGKTMSITNGEYKFLTFNKQIKDIRVDKSDIISIEYDNSSKEPFRAIKLFAKKAGSVNSVITFYDGSKNQLYFNVINDITVIKKTISKIAENINITQVENNIILNGSVKNNKIKNKVLGLLKDVLPNIKVTDLTKIEEPDKMVRLKLYVAEINNRKGETIKNNWSYNSGIDGGKTTLDMTSDMLNSVTLSGGLTVAANKLGSIFNTGLTLNYLKSNGVAKILDETTLITLENKKSNFLAGGKLLVETATTSSEGIPVSSIEEFSYGLNLNILVSDIINDKYVKLNIHTESSTLDKANGVGDIPAVKEKSIKTDVIVENKSTIVLGGLINNTNSQDIAKIPFLGDIPIIGVLFRSQSFQQGDSELVFFITPTIVDVSKNNQLKDYKDIKQKIIPKTKIIKKELIDSKELTQEEKTNKQLHEDRLKNIFGII